MCLEQAKEVFSRLRVKFLLVFLVYLLVAVTGKFFCIFVEGLVWGWCLCLVNWALTNTY